MDTVCRLYRKLSMPALSAIFLLTPCAFSSTPAVGEICQILRQRESVIKSIKYEMTQIKHRTADGTKLLEQLRPGTVLKLDEPEAPARRDFTRVREAQKDSLEDVHYDEDLKTVSGRVLHAWDGSIGKRYIPKTKSGRIERKPFSVSEEFPEKAGLELMGKPLHQWLSENQETAQVRQTPDGTVVEFQVQRDIIARYLLDPAKGFLTKSYKIIKSGETAYEMTVNEYGTYTVDGVDIRFPIKYESTMSIPKVISPVEKGEMPKIKMVPLVVASVEITKVQFNTKIPQDQFDIEFPADARIYDEFLGEFTPDPQVEKILVGAIDRQVNRISRNMPLIVKPIPPNASVSQTNQDTNSLQNKPPASGNNQNQPGKVVQRKFRITWGTVLLVCGLLAVLIVFIQFLLSHGKQRSSQ